MASKTAPSQPENTQPASVSPATLKVPVNDDVLRRVYAQMLKCRSKNGGQDAVALSKPALAGAVVELSANDAVLLTTASGSSLDVAGPSVIPTNAAGSAYIAIAVGVALAAKLQRSAGVVLAFTDAPTLGFGATHEALTFAATHKVPLVLFAESTAANTGDIARKADAYSIPAIMVDVNDAVAIYRVAKEAIHHARGGRGPSLIECCASDIDPLAHMEAYLRKQGSWSNEWKHSLLE